MKNLFWLVTTDHLTDRIWFRDEDDFKAGMNLVAVLAATVDLIIISFILMSNHVHFMLGCDRELAEEFIRRFKQKYSQYYSNKYGSCALLRDNDVDFRLLQIEDESFERGLAYIQMNSVAANICLHPSLYPWGTGNCFFNKSPLAEKRIGELSGRSRVSLLHSKLPVPANYRLDERGFVDPRSYVPVKFVESVFRTPKRMDWFMRNSSKAKRIIEAPSFNDQLISSAVRDLSTSLFRKSNTAELDDMQSAELFRQIRYRFSSDPAQIARVCGVPYERVCSLLQAF